MQQTNTHISILLDRSGSMESIGREVINSMNAFLQEQKQGPGDATVTLAQFDSVQPFDLVLDGTDITKVRALDPSRYRPRGLTPLYDAIGLIIRHIDTQIATRADNAEPIQDQLVLIVTDGIENASSDFTRETIKHEIELRQNRTWTFRYMGANQDAEAEAENLAIPRERAQTWTATAAGTDQLWADLSRATTAHRTQPATSDNPTL